MTDLSNIPRQSNFETTLASPIDSSQTTGITLAVDPDYTPGGETIRVTILNPKGVEHLTCTGWTANVLSGVTRGVASYTGGPSTARAHGAGVKVIIGNPWQLYDDIKTAINSKIDETDGVCTTPLTDATYASLAALKAAYPEPATNGKSAYCTAEGKSYDVIGGTWTARESGGTFANASTTVAGKKEDPTDAEVNAGTDTGGTGATMSPTPSQVAKVIQNSQFVYAASSAGNDTYAITVTPAIAAYATGQRFIFKADVANTGAATLDVNGKGAIAIKKNKDAALEDNDIKAGSIVEVVYDGTNFQMQTPSAAGGLSAAQITTLTGGGSAESLHTHTVTFGSSSSASFAAGVPADTVIAHGLGVAPKQITVFASVLSVSNQCISHSDGGYTSSGNKCNYWFNKAAATCEVNNAAYAIYVVYQDTTNYYGYGTITVDATNITITWGRSAANFVGVIYYTLQATN